MINRRKQEIQNCLKEIRSHSHYLVNALKRDSVQGEELALKSIQSELKLMMALYEDLQKLRGG